jgi:hypothetical protein
MGELLLQMDRFLHRMSNVLLGCWHLRNMDAACHRPDHRCIQWPSCCSFCCMHKLVWTVDRLACNALMTLWLHRCVGKHRHVAGGCRFVHCDDACVVHIRWCILVPGLYRATVHCARLRIQLALLVSSCVVGVRIFHGCMLD